MRGVRCLHDPATRWTERLDQARSYVFSFWKWATNQHQQIQISGLAEVDQRKGQVVEMRFFRGLSVEEAAEVLKVSMETVMRDWRLAKMWLMRELRREEGR